MATEIATAYVSLVPSARGLSDAIHKEMVGPTNKVAGEAGHQAGTTFGNRFSGAVSTIAKATALGLAGAAVLATKFISDSIGEADEARKVARQTEAVIASTGGAANVSAKQVDKLVTALSLKAGVDDELIASGANVLLTFTKVRNEVGRGNDIFNQATDVALDMSVALGQDLQSSVTQIGKALNDPIAGISALTRVGVQFTDQQKDQIKTLVESGDVLGAQKVILAELTTQFGGSAAAQATATDKLKVAFGNISEQIGGVLLPYVDAFSAWMVDKGVPLIQDRLVPALEDFAHWIADEVVPAIRDELIPRLVDLGGWISDNVIPPLEDMGGILVDDIIPAVQDVAEWIGDHLVPVLEDLVPQIKGANEAAEDGKASWLGWAIALGAVALALTTIAEVIAPVLAAIATGFKVLGTAVALAGHVIVGAILVILSPIALVGAAIVGLTLLVVRNWDTIRDAIVGAAEAVIGFLANNWPLILGILTGPIGLAVAIIATHWQTIMNGVTAAKDWIVARFVDVINFVAGLPGALARAAAGLWDWITSGISAAVGWAIDRINDLIRAYNSIPVAPNIPTIGGGKAGQPVKKFHSGGIFHAPPGQSEGLAILAEGERVTRPGAGVPTVSVYVQGSILTQRELVGFIRDELKRGGFQ